MGSLGIKCRPFVKTADKETIKVGRKYYFVDSIDKTNASCSNAPYEQMEHLFSPPRIFRVHVKQLISGQPSYYGPRMVYAAMVVGAKNFKLSREQARFFLFRSEEKARKKAKEIAKKKTSLLTRWKQSLDSYGMS